MPNTGTSQRQRPLHAPQHETLPQVIQTPEPAMSGWVGWIWFGVAMMAVVGIFDIIGGLVAIFDDNWLVGAAGKLFVLDSTAWGWTTLAIGLLVLAAAGAVMRGAIWGRTIAVIMAAVNMVAHLSLTRAYPVWSLLVIMLNVFVIYALIVHGGELRERGDY